MWEGCCVQSPDRLAADTPWSLSTELGERLFDYDFLQDPVVNQHAVSKPETFARLEDMGPVLLGIVGEIGDAKGVCREEPIPAHVPVGGMAKIRRMIENRDTEIGRASCR